MKIAITGTIGSGKTEVIKYLETKKQYVFICDEANNRILDERSYELLYNDFFDCFDEKVLNRKKLANIIFSNYDRKKILEDILHPIILKKMLDIKESPLFAEVPLLFECGWDMYFDKTILIVCDETIAINRLATRGFDYNESKRRILWQMPIEEKIKKATIIIYNNGSLDELYSSVDKILEEIC